jgi:hypothetical protein
VGCWHLNEATGSATATDSSSSALTGTLTGMDPNTDWVTGRVFGGLEFDGTAESITMGDVLDFETTAPFSLAVWVKLGLTDPTTAQTLVAKANSSGAFTGYYLQVAGTVANDPLGFALIGAGSVNNRVQIRFPRPNDLLWHLVVVTYDGSGVAAGMAGYVDGVLQTPTVERDTLTGSTVTTLPFTISSRNGAIDYVTGTLDEVQVYSHVLSPAAVLRLYTRGRLAQCR